MAVRDRRDARSRMVPGAGTLDGIKHGTMAGEKMERRRGLYPCFDCRRGKSRGIKVGDVRHGT